MLAKDHKGTMYKSMKQMTDAWNINYDTFVTRLERGWSIEQALTTPARSHQTACIDPLGRRFTSIRQMAKAWDIPPNTYFDRIHDGWSVAQALTVPYKPYKKHNQYR